MSFNDFTPLGVRTSGRFLGHSGLALRSLLGNFVQLGANLSIWSLLRNHFVPFTKNIFCRQTFKKICNHTTNLVPLRGHLWVTLGLLWVYEGGFGSPWGHFGVTLAEVSNRLYSPKKKLTFAQWILMILSHWKVEQVGIFRVILGLLCGHFCITSHS